jgi:cytochrome P450
VGPPHERLRRIAHRGFTPRRIVALEQPIRSYADELLDQLSAGDEIVDLTEYAERLTLRVVISLLGTPLADGPLVLRWVERASANFGNIGRKEIDRDILMDSWKANQEFCDYIAGFLEDSRAGRVPRSELADTLLDAEEDERMSTEELIGMFMLLLSAGHDTTKNLVSLGSLELLRHRSQWERLCADPSFATTAVDELLRWTSPLLISFRISDGREVEYGGVTVPADTVIMPVVAAANRDPAVFENPNVLDLGRSNARNHLAFGFGTNFCLGNALARLEGGIAFERLATRFPDLELAGDVEYHGSFALRALRPLPVRLGRDREMRSGPP